MVQGYVMISINVKLLSTGGRNTVRERVLYFQRLMGFFENAMLSNKDNYIFIRTKQHGVFGWWNIRGLLVLN